MRPLAVVLEEVMRALTERQSAFAWMIWDEYLRPAGWNGDEGAIHRLMELRTPSGHGWLHPPAPAVKVFPKRLRQARKARKMTQAALAEALGYSGRSMVCHYEAGTAKPTLEVVARMAEVLGVDAVWLSGLGG